MGATPQDEIDRQHQEAESLLDSMIPTSCEKGEISLRYKQSPASEWFGQQDNDEFPLFSTRGYVNVAKIQELIREGYNNAANIQEGTQADPRRKIYGASDVKSPTNLWDPMNAAVNNVAVCRPSHDAWGINKIVLIFCDDFLRDIFQLPWWHERADIREAILPVLDDVLHVPVERVVRMILASLPTGVTIPFHHDTGVWVKHTHRIHVPILVDNPNKVLFRSGLNNDTLRRIDVTPGHVFELNNQAIHAVSNCADDHRVHLILDYVDQDFDLKPHIPLQPGEILLQTRRSIDRLANKGSRPTPSFLILGAQKAGTTSLYEYLTQHPLIVPARRRETHCFDWRWNDKLKTVEQQREWCHKFYYAKELALRPSCLTGDSTPSYLLDSLRVIPRIQAVFNWPLKFFVMCREPIRRAESHFAMVTSTEGTPAQLKARGCEWRNKSFRQVALEDFRKMKSCGLIPYWDVDNGTLDEVEFAKFSGSKQEDEAWTKYLSDIPLNTGSHSLITRGLYELQLRPWLRAFDRTDFLIIELEQMKAHGVQTVLQGAFQHLGVPHVEIRDDAPKNTRDYVSSVDDELRGYLQRFYAPHNRCLFNLLDGSDDWLKAWTYEEMDS